MNQRVLRTLSTVSIAAAVSLSSAHTTAQGLIGTCAGVIQSTIAEANTEGPYLRRRSEGDIVRLADAERSIYVVWTDYCPTRDANCSGNDDDWPARLVGTRSIDGGRVWFEPRQLTNPESGERNRCCPSLLRPANASPAELYLYFGILYTPLQRLGVYRSAFTNAIDLAERLEVSAADQYNVPINGRVVQLTNGTILYPIAVSRDGGRTYESIVYFTRPELPDYPAGRQWQHSNPIQLPRRADGAMDRGAMEPVVVEVPEIRPGTAPQFLRTERGRIWQAWSNDYGQTWGNPTETEIVAPSAPSSLARVGDGRILLLYNRGDSRRHLVARIGRVVGSRVDWGNETNDLTIAGPEVSVEEYTYASIRVEAMQVSLSLIGNV